MDIGEAHRLDRRPETGTWFRALRLRHWETLLDTAHSSVRRSRFSAADAVNPGYRIAYFGQTHQLTLHEVRALLGDPSAPVPDPRGSWMILSLVLVLDNVVDLCNSESQRILKTNHQELTGNWDNPTQGIPTQSLGRALHDLPEVEGFLYPSSLVDGRCLAVFPDKLGARSSITFFNEMTNREEWMT